MNRRAPSGRRRPVPHLFLALGALALGGDLHGQEAGDDGTAPRVFQSVPGIAATAHGPAAQAQSALQEVASVSPRGAFLRSLVLPGWGHAAAGAPGRAAFYVAAQGGTYWMLARSLIRQRSAARYRDAEFDLVAAELQARGVASDSLARLATDDPRVERWAELVDIRGDQVEDWLALGIFLSLLGATDALVSAHMADYPEPLALRVGPGPRGTGGWQVGLSLPLAPWRPEGRRAR
jgi:hypothetical protein